MKNQHLEIIRIDGKGLTARHSAYFITIVFRKSRAPSLNEALLIAQSADFFEAREMGPTTLYIAGFSGLRPSCLKAQLLLQYCGGWKGTMCLIWGEATNLHTVVPFLDCYITALACDEPKAHCYGPANYGDGITEIIVSCKLAASFFPKGVPATLEDQLQAKAVAAGCNRCPLFKVEIMENKDCDLPKKFPG